MGTLVGVFVRAVGSFSGHVRGRFLVHLCEHLRELFVRTFLGEFVNRVSLPAALSLPNFESQAVSISECAKDHGGRSLPEITDCKVW